MEISMFKGAVLSVFLSILLLLSFHRILRRFANVRPPLPPGPRGLPLLGYLPFLGTNLHREFGKLAETYGPIYKLWLGNKLCMVVTSPSLVKEINRDHDVVFANRDITVAASTLSYDGKDIAFADYGPHWRSMRKFFVREMMSNSSLAACYSLRRREVRKCIESLYDRAGSAVDIGELAHFLLTNTIMAMLWGHSLEGEKGKKLGVELRKVMGEIMVIMGKPNISDIFPALARFDVQGVKRHATRLNIWFQDFLSYVIACAAERRINKGVEKEVEAGNDEKTKDIVQLFLDLQMDWNKSTNLMSTADNQELKALLTDIILGGTDTTSTMVEWAMAELLHHRDDVLVKVMAELTEVVGMDNIVEESDLPKLKYLDAVIKETLRLHPAAPLLLSRRPSQSVIVGRYTIPKDATVFVNVWAMHRDPQLWENPLEFRPERFLENPGDFDFSGNNFAYLPFGTGRRICAGLPLAEKMLKYIVASLLHSFEWELPEGTELEFSDKFGTVTKKMKPLVAISRPRLSRPELYMCEAP